MNAAFSTAALEIAALETAGLVPATAGAGPATLPAAHAQRLRFITCGSVDDGKSTLIGRLLFEAGAIYDDQLDTLTRDSVKFGTNGGAIDYALLVDGLSAEREQGITIDVAYRYFATPKRSFIVADTPGHEQYTRNMATGASSADLAIILIDARKGVLPQTRRHSFIVALAGVKQVVVAVNKMDLVEFDAGVFRRIEAEYRALNAELGFSAITFIPVAARDGDNISAPSLRMPWYQGPSLLPYLEAVEITGNADDAAPLVFPIQWVNRPDLDFRGFAGTLARGTVRPGDAVVALPSGQRSTIARIVTQSGDKAEAIAGEAVTLTLADEIDLSRGDVLVSTQDGANHPQARCELDVRLLATGEKPLRAGDQFIVKLATASANARLMQLDHAIDIETYAARPAASLPMNGIGLARLRFDKPLVATGFATNTTLGGLILIDRLTNETVAFGFIEPLAPLTPVAASVTARSALTRLIEPALERSLGVTWRRTLAPAVAWRLGSAALLGLALYALTGRAGLSAAIGLADAVLRPLLRIAYARFWSWLRRPPTEAGDPPLTMDGGGI